jgi:tetrapyrrole methylase family protein/MazG family protein
VGDQVDKFIKTINRIRDPNEGCVWNLEQTHSSLKRYLLEELYETLDALDKIEQIEIEQNFKQINFLTSDTAPALKLDDKAITAFKELQEELGDLLLQIVLHSRMAEEKGIFSFEDVARSCNEKMVKRHPHVFIQDKFGKAKNTSEVDEHWDREKLKEKHNRDSIFSGIPKELPALASAWLISKKAVKESFEWDQESKLFDQLESEIRELQEVVANARANGNDPYTEGFVNQEQKKSAELEIGDILFTIVNIARWYRLDPEESLRKTNNKFKKRFDNMMNIAKSKGKKLKDFQIIELESLWKEAKLLD